MADNIFGVLTNWVLWLLVPQKAWHEVPTELQAEWYIFSWKDITRIAQIFSSALGKRHVMCWCLHVKNWRNRGAPGWFSQLGI